MWWVIAGEDGIEPKPSPKPVSPWLLKLWDLGRMSVLWVGDHPVNDVVGAKSAGIYAALLDPAGLKGFAVKPDYVVSRLSEVVEIVFGKHF
jgi:FMN phosphatase YigB (HAD superfamily)